MCPMADWESKQECKRLAAQGLVCEKEQLALMEWAPYLPDYLVGALCGLAALLGALAIASRPRQCQNESSEVSLEGDKKNRHSGAAL